jgi:hypothetical protein
MYFDEYFIQYDGTPYLWVMDDLAPQASQIKNEILSSFFILVSGLLQIGQIIYLLQ